MNQNTNDGDCRRTDRPASMTMLLGDVYLMADVLGFLARRELALQLASVSVAFSALCNCWCQEEQAEADTESNDNGNKAIAAFDRRSNRSSRGRRCWSCTFIHSVHFVRHLSVIRKVMVPTSEGDLCVNLPNTGQFNLGYNVLLTVRRSLALPTFLISAKVHILRKSAQKIFRNIHSEPN